MFRTHIIERAGSHSKLLSISYLLISSITRYGIDFPFMKNNGGNNEQSSKTVASIVTRLILGTFSILFCEKRAHPDLNNTLQRLILDFSGLGVTPVSSDF